MYISKLKEDWKSKHNIDPDKHMARLNHLGNKAEQKDMFGVALRAEELRGKVAGYHVDRSLIKTSNDLNDKTEEEKNLIRSKENEFLSSIDWKTGF